MVNTIKGNVSNIAEDLENLVWALTSYKNKLLKLSKVHKFPVSKLLGMDPKIIFLFKRMRIRNLWQVMRLFKVILWPNQACWGGQAFYWKGNRCSKLQGVCTYELTNEGYSNWGTMEIGVWRSNNQIGHDQYILSNLRGRVGNFK